jgi:hypothetical protein
MELAILAGTIGAGFSLAFVAADMAMRLIVHAIPIKPAPQA